jgi:hypothetical protein
MFSIMKQTIRLITLLWVLFLIAGCGSGGTDNSANSTEPPPTIHPLFSTLPELSTRQADAESEEPSTSIPEDVGISTEDDIHDVLIVFGDNNVIVTWATDNLALGSIVYGQTEQYEMGETGEDLPLSQHAFILDGFEPETTYYYRITSVDTKTNAVSIYSDSFITLRQSPLIDVWYGLEQTFGQHGTPQRWLNVLGNVSDSDGVDSLGYSLNGGEEMPLSIGPDQYRLSEPGDFNVDIDRTLLLPGENELVLRAVDPFDNQEVVTVTLNYSDDNVWPGTYAIDWQTETNIQDAAEVVDGLWEIKEGKLHTVIPGYNRFVTIGDLAWTDYEVTVPITVHNVNYIGEDSNDAPKLGLLMRWTGHTDIPVANMQPRSGWLPFGAVAGYRWDNRESVFLQLGGSVNDDDFVDTLITEPQWDVVYNYKFRVETMPNGGSVYSLKVWPDDQPEPEAWDLSSEIQGLPNGSLLLFAHQVDASFGNVMITQLAPPTPLLFLPDLFDLAGVGVSVEESITNTTSVTTTVPITTTDPNIESGLFQCNMCTASIPDVNSPVLNTDMYDYVADMAYKNVFIAKCAA